MSQPDEFLDRPEPDPPPDDTFLDDLRMTPTVTLRRLAAMLPAATLGGSASLTTETPEPAA